MTEKQFTKYILDTKQSVDKVIKNFYVQKINDAAEISSEYKKLLTLTSQNTMRGGKRLRPALAILGYEAAGGKLSSQIVTAASALEIFHNFLLIHDDIIDRDEIRHGGPTIEAIYKNEYLSSLHHTEATHFASSMALLAGDINCGLCYELLLSANYQSKHTIAAIARLNQAIFEVAGGQQLDTLAAITPMYSVKKLLSIARHKTAGYTMELPLQFGALLAGSSQSQLSAMAEYGENIGIAFQITDDILGIFGDTKTTGKPNVSDLREGKQTLLMYYGLALANNKDKAILDKSYGNSKASSSDLQIIRDILTRCGALAKTQKMQQKYFQQALPCIVNITQDETLIQKLHYIAQYCINRKH